MMENATNLNELFEQAKKQSPQVDAASVLQLMKSGLKGPSSIKNTWMSWKIFLGIGMLSILGCVAWFSSGMHEASSIQKYTHSEPEGPEPSKKLAGLNIHEPSDSLKNQSTVEKTDKQPKDTLQPIKEPERISGFIELIPQTSSIQPIQSKVEAQKTEALTVSDIEQLDEYIFPKLTEEEIAANHKNKRHMLKDLAKQNDKVYAYIPSGSYMISGDSVSVQSFYMRTTEITNLEYRTFLFDLLIQDRKSEFLKAKPNQAMWAEIEGGTSTPMQDHYFSHEAFNNYPVVNVPFEGAQLYCRWLTTELNQVLEDKRKSTINDVRLPSSHEFRYAASSGGKHLPFPWPKYMESANLQLANYDGKGAIRDTLVGPAHAEAYFDNEFGLRNISGNCAEWCVQKTAEGILETIALGGGWMDELSTLEITSGPTSNSSYNGHPNVGFRVVLTYLSRSK